MKTVLRPQLLINLLLVIALVLLLSWSIVAKPWQPLLADLSTRNGEHITVLLEDSTQLSLAENSMADIVIGESQRSFSFIAGKFNVETSALCVRNLPVVVNTPHGKVNPGDSRFSLEIKDNEAWLNVEKGSVTLHRNNQAHVISADQTVHFTRQNVAATAN